MAQVSQTKSNTFERSSRYQKSAGRLHSQSLKENYAFTEVKYPILSKSVPV